MPAGDLIDRDYQLELRSMLMGDNTMYTIDRSRGAIKGLGMPPAKTADTELDHADGSYGGEDYTGPRVITVALLIKGSENSGTWNDADSTWNGSGGTWDTTGGSGTSPGGALNGLSALNDAWAASTTDIPLYLRLPGWGKFHVNGRPRGLDEDLSLLTFGLIVVMATFVALDPTIYWS